MLTILAATLASLLTAPALAALPSASATTTPSPHPDWTAMADSEQPDGGLARNAIDGNPATAWHTAYNPTPVALPHALTIDMNATNIVSGLRYQPRTDGSLNGNIGQYQIHVSTDRTTWGNPVASGTFLDNATAKFVSFVPISARYVRLTALTEAGNRGPWSCAAEIDVVVNPVHTLPRSGWTVTADSQQPSSGPVTNAIDGDPATAWHTASSPTLVPLPHMLTIDMNATNIVSGLRYQPRSDGNLNGNIGQYQIHVSTDGTTWGNSVATSAFTDDSTEKGVFFAPVAARYVRLTALTEAGSRGPWSSAAEINLTNNPLSAVQCAPNVPIYTTRADQHTFVQYQHLEPETGANSWSTQQQIGTWGLTTRHIAGPNGSIYDATNSGELRRMRWHGTGWDTFANGLNYEIIDTNSLWARYSTPEYFNRIAVDTEGDIYTIEPDGWLHWRRYNATTRIWAHRLLKRSSANLITAAGPGVIFSRGSYAPSSLDYFEYHPESQRSRSRDAGSGWDVFSRVFSPGGGLLYAIRADNGDLMWYRYNPDADLWANGALDDVPVGLRVGTGWQTEYETFAAPDSCRLSDATWRPTRPPVTPRPHDPVTMMLSSNGHLHYSYVAPEGRAIYAEVTDLTGGTPVRLAAVPGMTGLTGKTSTAENAGGRIQIVGNGLDAETYSNTQAAIGGPWAQADTLGGFFDTSPTLVRLDSTTLTVFAVDENGVAWIRNPICADGPRYPWYQPGFGGQTAPRLSNQSQLAVVITVRTSASNTMLLIGQSRDGGVYTYSNLLFALPSLNCLTVPVFRWNSRQWRSLGGNGFISPPSAVVMPELVKIFATGLDGVVYAYRPATDGAPEEWTAVSEGLTAGGPPSAILAPDGEIKVVVRGNDGFIYYTSQTGPGSTTFDPWQPIVDSDETATDPTAVAFPAGNTWVVAYRTDLDVPRLRRYVPSALAAGNAFVDVPLTPPAG